MSYGSIIANKSGASFQFEWDWTQFNKAIDQMDSEANALMSKAIADVLRKELEAVRQQLKRGMGISGSIQDVVGDSFVVEEFIPGVGGNTMVRAGSDPMDTGGVTGSRGGKLAQYLEYGVRSFDYPFKGKTVDNSVWFGKGRGSKGFINRYATPRFPGIKPQPGQGWLTETYNRSIPQIADAIKNALNEAWA